MMERWCRLSPSLPQNLGSQFLGSQFLGSQLLGSQPRSSSKAPPSRGAEAPRARKAFHPARTVAYFLAEAT
jgi:hypothetical protein